MCPRDYLSSYMKIGVIVVLAVGIFVAHPTLKMPATTPFISRRRAGHHRAGLAVPVHRDHVRRDLGVPLAGGLGHDAQDGLQGIGHPPDRLRRDGAGRLRGRDRADRRLRAGAGRLLRHQLRQGRGTSRCAPKVLAGERSGTSRREELRRSKQATHEEAGRRAPAARSRWPWAWPRSSPTCRA